MQKNPFNTPRLKSKDSKVKMPANPFPNLTLNNDSIKMNMQGLDSTGIKQERRSKLNQTLEPISYNPESAERKNKSQSKTLQKFNMTALLKDFETGFTIPRPKRKDPKRGSYL